MPAADRLIHSLRAQPLLVVLRPPSPRLAGPRLKRPGRWGIRHVQIAWQPGPRWVEEMAELDPALLHAAAERDLVLVPGVMTASEVHAARRLGCLLVKLFPGGERGDRPLAASAGAPGQPAAVLHRRWRIGAGGCGALAESGRGCGGAGVRAGRGVGGSRWPRGWLAGAAGGVASPTCRASEQT